MLRIVWIVIDCSHRAEFLKALDKHTFRIHVGKSKRPLDFGHALRASPFLHSLDECTAHFRVVNEINPSETHRIQIPSLVSLIVDDACHAPHHLAVLIGKIVHSLTKLHCRVLVRERVEHILIDVRNRIFVILVKFIVETDELLHLTFSFNLLN